MTSFRRSPPACAAGVLLPGAAFPRRAVLGALTLLAGPARAAWLAPLRLGGTGMGLAITALLLDLQGGTEDLPGVTVLPSLGTSGGLAALTGGRIDLAVVSRDLRPAELAAGLTALPIARTPIAFATRQDTPAHSVTSAQAAAMLAGDLAEWPRGGPVRVVRRDRSETDWQLLSGASPAMAAAIDRALERPGLAIAGSDQDNAELLESLPGSFGLTTLGQTSAEHRRLRLLALDGVAPDLAALRAGRYHFERRLLLVWRADAPAAVTSFARFAGTSRARQALLDFGFVPLPEGGA